MFEYVLQADPLVSRIECNVVRHAAMIDDAFIIRQRRTLDELRTVAEGSVMQAGLCPVGSVEFCRAWMRAVGAPEPPALDYPAPLSGALGRQIRRCSLIDAPLGSWIKPVSTKAWEAHVKVAGESGDESVWWSPYLPPEIWRGEWRIYVVDGKIVGEGRYDDGADEHLSPDRVKIAEWVASYEQSGSAPAGYALDVGLVGDQFLLIEATDGWACGYYKGTCAPRKYARLLGTRWRQLKRDTYQDTLLT